MKNSTIDKIFKNSKIASAAISYIIAPLVAMYFTYTYLADSNIFVIAAACLGAAWFAYKVACLAIIIMTICFIALYDTKNKWQAKVN
ncbi:MAG TPA: hypothetical protein DCL21_03250 [Alphaproteobacteria bacterium]|nr:hypothetical protein [Alphaproteobacteria bacterium]